MKKIIPILLLLLTACSKPLYGGTVIEKCYEPAHKVYQPIVIPGKNVLIIPHWIHYSDRWYIWIQNGEEKDSWDVTEEYYNSVEVGDYVTSDQVKDAEEELRKWIADWETQIDIYLKYKDSDNPEEIVLADDAKAQANEIASYYNNLILKDSYLFGETLPEGIYAAIEVIE